jgi:type IX secretion system PorP/SprF family membrane protein
VSLSYLKYAVIAALVPIALSGSSQDVHFSQYYASPSLMNPGTTGMFGGTSRFALNYRNQWTMINSNYQTTAAAFETALMKKKSGGNFLGVGANVISDKAGIGAMKRLSFSLNAAYHLQINDENNIGLGIQGGYAQRSIDQGALTWDNQYDGSQYVASMDPKESFQDNVSYIDIDAGFHWSYEISHTADVNAGVGVFHLSNPKGSILAAGEDEGLPMKIIAHGLGRFTRKGTDLAYYPNFMVAFQGPAKEITAGMSMRYMLKESSKYTGFVKGNAIFFGANYRLGDAAIVLFGIELSDWKLGMSYDVNVSGFNKATGGVGGIELSLVWVKSD